jgi:orotate phosphoribosyltransferase
VTERDALARDLAAACYLTGTFQLRSGAESSFYFDKYQFAAAPALLRRVVLALAPLIPEGTQVLAGLELGAVPIATALSLETGISAAFVRKTAKAYGTRRLVEGAEIRSKHVCVIEDVITTGGQVLASVRELQALGAVVTAVLCILWRGAGEPLLPGGLTCRYLFTSRDLAPFAPHRE